MNNRFLARLRVGSLSALFLFSSLALSFTPWLTSRANAVSAYDDVVTVLPALNFDPLGGGCSGYSSNDWSLNWTQIFESATGTTTIGQTGLLWDWTAFGSNYASASTSWDNKQFWGVSVSDNGSYDTLLIYWTEGTDLVGDFVPTPNRLEVTSGDATYHWASFFVTNYGGGCKLFADSYTNTDLSVAQNVSTGTAIGMFVANLSDINYPAGYEGEEIPSEAGPNEAFYPRIGYHVTDSNEVNGLWLNQPECAPIGLTETTGCGSYKLKWTILGPDGTTVLNQVTQDRFVPYKYQLPGNDTYTLTAETVSWGPPALPLSPDVDFLKLVFGINANGTFVVGGTELNECTIDGSDLDCGEADPFEDCSEYGSDIGGYFQCVINNFGIWLRSTLINLFIPTYSFFSSFQTELGEFLNSKLGFVATAFSFVVGIFGGIVTGAVTTTCTVAPPGTIFGATFSVDICFIEDNFPTAFGVMQGLIIALTVIALFFAGLRKYHEVVDQR